MSKPKFIYKYAITARDSAGGKSYYVVSMTQGNRMISNAHSMAFEFDKQRDAYQRMSKMMELFQGLTDWDLEYRKMIV